MRVNEKGTIYCCVMLQAQENKLKVMLVSDLRINVILLKCWIANEFYGMN